MNKRNLFVRITAIVLCAIMILSVFAVAFSVFAAEPTVTAVAAETVGEAFIEAAVAA